MPRLLFCKRGHDMSVTRKVYPSGVSQCRVCREKVISDWHKKHLDKAHRCGRNFHLRKSYGMVEEEYQQMVAKQDHKCLICKRYTEKLFIDHHHITNRVRGLLCRTCNTGLGSFKENIDWMKEAIIYLGER
jgi:hypothetical protein